MSKVNWEDHDAYLKASRHAQSASSIKGVQNSFQTIKEGSPAYQRNASVNGEKKALMAVRRDARSCIIHTTKEERLFIGDLVECYGERWIVVQGHTNEYGLRRSEAWLCNQLFKFQNGTSDIIERWAVVDDGAYSKETQRQLKTIEGKYTIYMSLDCDTEKIFVDKRLALNAVYGSAYKKILNVLKIVWIDSKNNNFGRGSHLLTMEAAIDVFDPITDNLSRGICDYIAPEYEDFDGGEPPEEPEEGQYFLHISGNDTIRIGTSRNYSVALKDVGGEAVEDSEFVCIWNIESDEEDSGITEDVSENTFECTINVPLNDALIGSVITITVVDEGDTYVQAEKQVEVRGYG